MQKNEALCAQRILICSSLAALLLTTPLVWAHDVSKTEASPADAAKSAHGGSVIDNNRNKPRTTGEGGTISLHFEGITAQEAFKLIAKQTGVQIMVSTTAQNRIVNMSLSDVPVDVAIQEVARAAGLLSIKGKDGSYGIFVPTPIGQIPPSMSLPQDTRQVNVAKPSEYTLRMFESKGDVDPEFSIIMRGSAQFDPGFVVEPPPLNLDEKRSPRTFVLPRGDRSPLHPRRVLPLPNRGLRRYDLPKSSNMLKLPQLKPGPLSGRPFVIVPDAASKQQQRPQPNAPQHRQQQP